MAVEQRSVIIERTQSERRVGLLTLGWWLLIGLGVAGFLWLTFYNLSYSPRPWFDEGEHVRVPKTLVQYGQYAVWSADGFRYFGPTIGVGPTVLLPIALIFSQFGVGLLPARLVMAAYLLVAAALYWWVGRNLWGSKRLAWLGLILLCSAPGLEFIAQGRQVLGENPALVFFLGGMLAWWRAHQQRQLLLPNVVSGTEIPLSVSGRDVPSSKWLFVAGGFWALAAITKSNYGLLLPPALVLVWLANCFYYRQKAWKWWAFAIPLVMVVGGMGGWYLVVLLFLGGGDLQSNLNLLRTASGGSAFVFSPARMLSAFKYLFSPEAGFGLVIPSLLYGLWLARRAEARKGLSLLALPVAFCVVWLGWFTFASVGWPRYAFPALALVPLFMARLIWDVAVWLNRRRKSLGLVLATLAVVAMVIWGITPQVSDTVKVDDGAQQLAAYLNQHVDRNAVIETWESELGFLTDHRYHYPPPELLDKAVRRKWLNSNLPPLSEIYQPEKLQPDYLINGSFAAWSELYPPALLTERYQLVANFGTYSLYRRVK
jgi:4-amino-4-deoxy-L-arabinose transferase-like glycosyltransferase